MVGHPALYPAIDRARGDALQGGGTPHCTDPEPAGCLLPLQILNQRDASIPVYRHVGVSSAPARQPLISVALGVPDRMMRRTPEKR